MLIAASVLLGGCLSARYRPAAKDTPAPQPLNATAAAADVSATVESVIIFHGPGSWKRNAYWDEYVIHVGNRGAQPATLASASLVGLAGRAVAPGDDPWELEKASRAAARADFWLPPGSGPQVGGGITAVGVGIGAGAALGAAGSGGLISTSAGAVIGAAAVTVVALPVAGGATLYRNASHRHDIEREFARRRLQFPVTVPPGGEVRGSLFFVITPGPRQLEFHYTAGALDQRLVVDVTPAGPLHLQRQADGDGPPRPPTSPAVVAK